MRSRSLVVLAILALGCLPAFAPNLRARDTHAGLRPDSSSDACMGCHVSEHEALASGQPTSAPIVADWMLEQARTCVDCHHLREPRDRAHVGAQLSTLAKDPRAP